MHEQPYWCNCMILGISWLTTDGRPAKIGFSADLEEIFEKPDSKTDVDRESTKHSGRCRRICAIKNTAHGLYLHISP
jgi:hypothetical protein